MGVSGRRCTPSEGETKKPNPVGGGLLAPQERSERALRVLPGELDRTPLRTRHSSTPLQSHFSSKRQPRSESTQTPIARLEALARARARRRARPHSSPAHLRAPVPLSSRPALCTRSPPFRCVSLDLEIPRPATTRPPSPSLQGQDALTGQAIRWISPEDPREPGAAGNGPGVV